MEIGYNDFSSVSLEINLFNIWSILVCGLLKKALSAIWYYSCFLQELELSPWLGDSFQFLSHREFNLFYRIINGLSLQMVWIFKSAIFAVSSWTFSLVYHVYFYNPSWNSCTRFAHYIIAFFWSLLSDLFASILFLQKFRYTFTKDFTKFP